MILLRDILYSRDGCKLTRSRILVVVLVVLTSVCVETLNASVPRHHKVPSWVFAHGEMAPVPAQVGQSTLPSAHSRHDRCSCVLVPG